MSFLETIVSHVRAETALRQHEFPASALRQRPIFSMPRRSLLSALSGRPRSIIAEIKKASPSKGEIRADFDPVGLAQALASHGASAISVLTEKRFFQGSLNDLEQIRQTVSVPLLRKDFIVDGYQLVEARSYGADAVLLIAALLEGNLLKDLQNQARSLDLDVLVEVHTEEELDSALRSESRLIGINNRNLSTFAVDLATTKRLLPKIPAGLPVVCESGIDSLAQIEKLEQLGVRNFLVGESLMRAPEPGAKLRELLS